MSVEREKSSTDPSALPFGAMDRQAPSKAGLSKGKTAPKRRTRSAGRKEAEGSATESDTRPKKADDTASEGGQRRTRSTRGRGRQARTRTDSERAPEGENRRTAQGGRGGSRPDNQSAGDEEGGRGGGRPRRRRSRRNKGPNSPGEAGGAQRGAGGQGASEKTHKRHARGGGPAEGSGQRRKKRGRKEYSAQRGQGQKQGARPEAVKGQAEGLFALEHAFHGHISLKENGYLSNKKTDIHVAPRLTKKYDLRDGSIVTGPVGRAHGRYKFELLDVETVDGKPPGEMRSVPKFKSLVTIDPDFHYAVGDLTSDISLRTMDLICPVGRGQRGLIVAPPRSGKTILMQKFAHAIEEHYTDVHVIILLVDERPEEATEWKRTMTRGEVYVSTNDEAAKNHVDVCEVVWRRCKRLVELGEDVVLILDSITRMARAYNHVHGSSGKTMSGGIDSRAMERPKQFFGSARNTETAGSLTILGTALVETGSRMDQVIFEEFKGTGNMELVLSRKLSDRRIFPAIDLQKSGTRKDEKLLGSEQLRLVNTLRRVLLRMHFAEAMELLIDRLSNTERNMDFLKRFELDPDQ